MGEWKEYKLIDVCEAIYSGGTPSSMIPSYWNGNLPWLSSGETNQRFIFSTEKFITQEGADNSSTRYAYKDSTVVASAGQGHTRGQASLLCINTYVNQSVIVLKPNNKCINPYFLYYNIDSRYNELRQLSDGTSTRGSLSGKILKELPIIIPSIEEQCKIASILKSLDDKIEVNRRINENLEQQAQALFKSWFVDFEPFKNGEFIESELGMIPKGWRVVELTSFGRIVCGKTPSKTESSYYGGNIPFIKIPDMHNKVFVELSEDNLSQMGDESQPAKRIPPYSILVSCIATVGLVCINTQESHTNQQINTIIPDLPIFRYYLYQKVLSLKDYLINLGRGGTATLNVNTKIFGSIKVVKPTDELLLEYDKLVSPLFNIIEKNQQESRRLASLRDTLLPKLMSGEIKIIEKAL